MINSVNTLEFLKPKLITMDKFSSTTTTTKFLPTSSPTRSFVTFGSHIINHNKTTIDLNKQTQQQQQQIDGEICHQEERVKVQHVENHTKLQNNNCWNNFRSLCNNLSVSPGIQNDDDKGHLTKQHDDDGDDNVNGEHDVIDVVKMEHSGIAKADIPIENIQTKSAFNLDLNKSKYHNNSIYINNNNNNGLIRTEMNDNNNDQLNIKQYHQNNCDIKRKQQTPDTAKVIVERKETTTTAPQRTEDQNNAYRHIESVHNYAKLKTYEDDDNDNQSPHGSRHSSYLDDEEDDEEEDDEEDNDVVDNGDYEERLELSNEEYPDVLYADYEDIIKRRQRRKLQKLSTSSDGALFTRIHNSSRVEACAQKPKQLLQHINVANSKMIKNIKEDEEEAHIDVDVETVETHSAIIPVAMPNLLNVAHHIADDSNVVAVKPDHHARRPMNAFLIFCKRHRAIVKERYKNLENRAITKILGDWWASLDDNDKKCFTNLAQQNKDAFFTANPNFKWYKLPAPPLRTLTTRPANGFGQDYPEEKDINVLETISNNTRSINHNSNNYFKLADEAQMGDLSQLMEDKSKTTKQCADLQQALGETSQFMSAHITAETMEENNLKRRFYNENSFSSNSSEEDNMEPKKKSARSCKGKRYQELINSGQIVTAIKKSKCSTRLSGATDAAPANSEINLKQNFTNSNNNDNNFANNNNVCQKRSVSESDNILSYDLNGFDLEERIKELPALDLDEYLQRKRNTKKKKKFSANGKKRGQRNNNNANDVNNKNKSPQATQHMRNTSHKNTTTAVGSQKRKARKESITRRDISAIEQEVASLLPLTIDGCCYFQEAPTKSKHMQSMEKDTESTTSLDVNISSEETSSTIIPLQSPDTKTMNNNKNNNNSNITNDNTSSSTSDLLILAEVAAKRTE